jgi:hypothetical protein
MIDAVLDLPAHLRKRLVSALESGSLALPYSATSLRSVLGIREGGEDVVGVLLELERLGVSGQATAAWIRSVEAAASRIPRPDLVWTGPGVPGLHARDTRRVYEELLGSAERSVWASTYAFFDGPRAFEVLARRMDARSELRVTLLLNIQRKRGDTTAAEQLVRRFADRFWKTDWPGSVRPSVYYDPRSLEQDGPGGVLHAKGVVADRAPRATPQKSGPPAAELRTRGCGGSNSVRWRSVIPSANACLPSQTPADGSAGVADGGSGHADTMNSCPARAAAVSDLRDHAVRPRDNLRGRHCLRRRCDG